MEGEDIFDCDGPNASRSKDREGAVDAQVTDDGTNTNGSDGTGTGVESVEGKSAEEKQKEAKELLVRSFQFRDQAISIFASLAQEKFNHGQAEHGGFLPRDVTSLCIKEELIDLMFYVFAFEAKVSQYIPKELRDDFFGKRKES